MMHSDPYQAVLEALGSKRRVLLATHSRPDGDALGSTAAMAMALQSKGIEARVLLFNALSGKYAFVLQENEILWFDVEKGWPGNVDLQSFDALLVIDTGTWSQLPGLKDHLANFKGTKIVVDHHLTQEEWADVKLVKTDAAAAGEIVADLLDRWSVHIDQPIATALFLAIATDTGWFQFSNTQPRTMRLAAALMEAGVDTQRIQLLAFQNERPQRLAIMGKALGSLELLAANRLAVMSLSKADFQATGADSTDTENLVNIPLQVGEVQVSILFVEQPEGGPIRANLRSKGQIDVAHFAQKFKGGGHARAAGLKMDGHLAAVRRAVGSAMAGEFARVAMARDK
jgi:phosphoesterase RecJ-like protein